MLPYIFWIDHSKVRQYLVEKVLSTEEVQLYTMTQFQDIDFLFQDLKPFAIFVEQSTWIQHQNLIKKNLMQSPAMKIWIGDQEPAMMDADGVQVPWVWSGHITMPLNASKLKDEILQFVKLTKSLQ